MSVSAPRAGEPRPTRKPRILIIVENLPLPMDRRVMQEAMCLAEAGMEVRVICPKSREFNKSYEKLSGIHIYRHWLPFDASGAKGYLVEYSVALFWEFVLAAGIFLRHGFDVIQACNPPDLIFAVALPFKLFGVKFIFDHHDINPELYEVKFRRKGFFHRALSLFERLTFRVADAVMSTTESFKRIAIERGRVAPERVFVVRSVPDLTRFRRMNPLLELRKKRACVAGYVGIMGEQDGVENFVRAIATLVNAGQTEIQAVIVGSGTDLDRLRTLATQLRMDEYITFTGYLSGITLLRAMSTFDVGVIPDPKDVYNDKIAMNKVFEYMTLGIPFAMYDLAESGALAADAALKVAGTTPEDLAAAILRLVNEPELRARMAEAGMARSRDLLNWEREAEHLLAAYRSVLSAKRFAIAE